MEIDLVYNYVNGNDEEWVRKRNEYAVDSYNSVCRFRDNHELLFSLRSVEKYAPWIRKIFILLDSRVPEWLNTDNEKIVLVDHSEFMPAELLPCYNSNVIESFLDRIPGLSELFLYANDDMFFGNRVTEAFFVKDGKPLIRMGAVKPRPVSYYDRAILTSQKMIRERYGQQLDLVPIHNIDVYTKSAIAGCREEFSEEFREAAKHRMRTEGDIQRVIFHYYMLVNDLCVLKSYRSYKNTLLSRLYRAARNAIFASRYLDFIFYPLDEFYRSKKSRLYFFRNPRLVCLNDSQRTTEEHLRRYGRLMARKFPVKSSFEK